MIFLLEYDRPQGKIIRQMTFDDAGLETANSKRLELEMELNRKSIDHEVVLLEAINEEALRKTHRRYFEDASQIGNSMKSSLPNIETELQACLVALEEERAAAKKLYALISRLEENFKKKYGLEPYKVLNFKIVREALHWNEEIVPNTPLEEGWTDLKDCSYPLVEQNFEKMFHRLGPHGELCFIAELENIIGLYAVVDNLAEESFLAEMGAIKMVRKFREAVRKRTEEINQAYQEAAHEFKRGEKILLDEEYPSGF